MEENKEQILEEETTQDESVIDTEETASETENTEQDSKGTGKKSEKKKLKSEKKEKENKLQEKIDALQQKVDEYEDRAKRQMAEFDNFRKRTEKEKAAMFETGARSVIEKILPVVDNFERGLGALSEEEKKQPFAEGMNMVYKQMMTELDKLEVKAIEAVGCEFDPNLHNAVMQVESDEYESGIIAQELQRGYTYRDTVIRYSMVAVVS